MIFEGPNGSGKTTIAEAIACAAVPPALFFVDQDGSHCEAPTQRLLRRTRSREKGRVEIEIAHAGEAARVLEPRAWFPTLRSPSPLSAIEALQDASYDSSKGLGWAAFAYRGHQPTPIIETEGPSEIRAHPLRGALSFGAVEPASAHFGQLLVNLDYEEAKALKEASRSGITAERKDELERIATSRRAMLDGIERALSEVLGREVTLEFPFEDPAPRVLLDGACVPLDLLGEGMRSTLAWLADLLVRLHRVRWEDPTRSPLTQDFWLILDEIDESLHPTMQMRILPALRRLFPCARIYLTTHSPFVVASAGEGCVFSIRPDARHQVKGEIAARELTPGQSLEWVVEEIFGAETGFIDAWTRDALRAHRADITRLRRKEALSEDDWRTLLERRAALLALNEQVQTVVAMQEVPVARILDARLAEPPRVPP